MSKQLKKVIYWQILSTFIASLIVWRYLGKLDIPVDLVVLLVLTLTPAHFFYEKFWDYYERTK